MKILGISAGTRNGNNDSMCKEALMGAKEWTVLHRILYVILQS